MTTEDMDIEPTVAVPLRDFLKMTERINMMRHLAALLTGDLCDDSTMDALLEDAYVHPEAYSGVLYVVDED